MAKDDAPLTPMQQDFVEHYLISLNATEAAIKAGFSPKTARVQASRLLSKANIMAVIEAKRKEKAEALAIEQDAVLLEVASVLHARFDEIVTWAGDEISMKTLEEIPAHARKAIKKIVIRKTSREDDRGTTTDTTYTVEMHDKIRAAEFMGRYFGLTTGDKGGDTGKNNPRDTAARGQRILESVRRMAAASRKLGGEGKES